MLQEYKSQEQYREYFATDVERYRCAPQYDFQRPPDAVLPPLYERHAPAAGERWREQARVAINSGGLERLLELLRP